MNTSRAQSADSVHPNVAAFLDMLAWSEGTDNGRQVTKDRGYDVIVGGATFDGYEDHPRKLVSLPKLGIASSAAGRYQLLTRWFDAYRKLLKTTGFGPLVQDRIAIKQIEERGAIPLIQAGRIEEAIAKTRNIWASLPGAGYGQHEQKMANLLSIYQRAGGKLA